MNEPHTPLQDTSFFAGPFAFDADSPVFVNGMLAGYQRYQRAYRDRSLRDQDLSDFFLRNCLDTVDPDLYNVGYLTGWLAALAGPSLATRQPSMCPPTQHHMHLGQTVIELTQGEDFRTGYQLGHLVAMRQTRRRETAETSIATLVRSLLAPRDTREGYVTGVVAGWLLTMSQHHLSPALLAVLAMPAGTAADVAALRLSGGSASVAERRKPA